MLPFYVYILQCSDNSYYVGHTDNIEQRLSEHKRKLCSGYTASRLPVKLVFVQECRTRDEAISAEQQIKGWRRSKKEALIRGDWDTVVELSNKK